ncbi:hypothetical protein ALI22I_34920 [Saccharothrix sp. ALI-22-I]|nr:hypothetical protein ALI22I_34920 [Saccharothrix sp. ALI-22-I]
MAIVAALLYLPGVLIAFLGAISLVVGPSMVFTFSRGLLMPPFSGSLLRNFELFQAISFVLPSLALILVVLLMCRVPGVRWALVLISLLAAVHYGSLLAGISDLPPVFGVMPVIALPLWLIAGLVAALPPVGRAMRGAKPKMPPQMAGPPPPQVPGPPPQGQWG